MSQRGRVLVVEDDYGARLEMAAVLREAGYEVFEASASEEALRLTVVVRPSLILLDLILPDGAGFDLLEDLRLLQAGARIPIIVVSGFTERVEEARSVGAEVDAYLLKPFGSSTLLATIAETLAPSAAGSA